jgi:RNA polymerase sigma-70 factor (ECF subfamily)
VGEGDRLVLDDAIVEALRRVRSGDRADDSVRALDGWLRPRLLRFFRADPLTRQDAEDLVQKTLSRVFLHVGGLEAEDRFVGWLFTVARNVRSTAIDRLRRERSVIVQAPEDARDPPAPRGEPVEETLATEQRLEDVKAAIGALPARQRQCLMLRVRDELSYEEIASTLRLRRNTVRNHIAEAKRNLRRVLAADSEEAR